MYINETKMNEFEKIIEDFDTWIKYIFDDLKDIKHLQGNYDNFKKIVTDPNSYHQLEKT